MRTVSFVTGAVAALAFVVPAFAQGAPQPAQPTPSGQSSGQNLSPHNQRIADRIRGDLEKSGFTNIQVMPESFLVRAKDNQGHPVMMVINPDSMTEVTALGTTGANGSSSNQTHAANTGSSKDSSGSSKL